MLEGLTWTLSRTAAGAVRWAGDLQWDATVSSATAVSGDRGGFLPEIHTARDLALPATVPGTVAGALRDAGLGPLDTTQADGHDWWWSTRIEVEGSARAVQVYRLELRGVATVSEIFWDGVRVAHSLTGLDDVVADLAVTPGGHDLAIVCRALSLVPVPRKPRPRWRSTLVADSSLRWRRTPLIGRIPWAGTAPVVGPWGEASLKPVANHGLEILAVRTEAPEPSAPDQASSQPGVAGGPRIARVHVRARASRAVALELTCAGSTLRRHIDSGDSEITLEVSDPQLWWPATHGTPALHRLLITADCGAGPQTVTDTHVGFRHIGADTTDGGFALVVNGRKIFARGAVWTPVEALTLGGSRAEIERTVAAMRAAGANLLRVSGTHAWEAEAFYEACDRHGLLVWQDAMLATLDPPSEPQWLELIQAELATWLPRLGAHPCLAVFSGGNEVLQQPVFWGRSLDSIKIPVVEEVIPQACAREVPGVVVVTSSPSGGTPPTRVDQGISHWFGVGAYRRPLTDALASGVRFAAEALAFGVPPAPAAIRRAFGSATADHDDAARAAWTASVARDPGASWDFEETTAHYARRLLYPGNEADTGASGGFPARSDGGSVDPVQLGQEAQTGAEGDSTRDQTPGERTPRSWWALPREVQLHTERMAAGRAVEHTLTHLRRTDSRCDGVIVLATRDLVPGAGWGLLDSDGCPKSTWYAMRRACAETAVTVTDDGLNGLHIRVFHDRPEPFKGMMYVRTWTIHGAAGPTAQRIVDLEAHQHVRLNLDEVLGGFLDLDHMWGFGPRQWEAIEVHIVPQAPVEGSAAGAEATAEPVRSLRAVRLLGGGHRDVLRDVEEGMRAAAGVQAAPLGDTEAVQVEVGAPAAAASLSVDFGADMVPDDDFLDLAPGDTRFLTAVPAHHWPAQAGSWRRDWQ